MDPGLCGYINSELLRPKGGGPPMDPGLCGYINSELLRTYGGGPEPIRP
jgi:hypothetical protein